MAKLTFEATYQQPGVAGLLQTIFGNEPDGKLYNYRVTSEHIAEDDYADALVEYRSWQQQGLVAQDVVPNYAELIRSMPGASLTISPVDKIGVKSFPSIGNYGFYSDLYENKSRMLLPIHNNAKATSTPGISVELVAKQLSITITGEKYMCYRILIKNGYDMVEYITYESSIVVPTPSYEGTWQVFCVGYVEEGRAVSFESNYVNVEITAENKSPVVQQLIYTKAEIDALISSIKEV